MKTGKCIRDSFKFYLDNPIIIIPFLIMGIISSIIMLFVENYIRGGFSTFESFEFPFLFSGATSSFLSILLNSIILLIVVYIFLYLLESYVEAYSIGLAKTISSNKEATFKDGLSTIGRGFSIFAMKFIVALTIVSITILISIPAFLLLGILGLAVFFVSLIIVSIVMIVITLFAGQSIVLEKKGAIQGILSSYKVFRKNLEGVVLLVIFIIFIAGSFIVVRQVSIKLLTLTLDEFGAFLISKGLTLFLFSIILAPYVLLLKTYYFIKNS